MKITNPVIYFYAAAIVTAAVSFFLADAVAATVLLCLCAVALDAGVVLHLIQKIRKKETVWRWCLSMVMLALAVTLLAIGEITHLS